MKKVLFYVRLCLSLAVFLYLTTMINWTRVEYIFPILRLGYMWQALILVLLSILVMSFRWTSLLEHFNVKQGIADSWRYYMISMFYGIMLPGIIGTDAVRLGLSIKKHAGRKGYLTTSVFFERICGLMVILMIAAVTILLVPSFLDNEKPIVQLINVMALCAILIFVLFFIVLKGGPEMWFNAKKTPIGIKANIVHLLSQFRVLPIKLLLVILSLSTLAHFLDITGSYCLARAMHIEQPLSFFLLIMPIVYVVTSLPISLGGLGIREGILTFLLVRIGVMASDAVLLAFLIYLNRMIVASIGGFIQFFNRDSRPLEVT